MGAGFVSHSESTARRLQRLAQLYQHGQASAVMSRTLENDRNTRLRCARHNCANSGQI